MRIKEITYKRFALIMALCYVMNLLQYQISPFLHMVSHGIELPVNIMSHTEVDEDDSIAHGHEEHGMLQVEHNHEIINLIDSLIKSNDSESSDETLLSELKFDKHILLQKIIKNKSFHICFTSDYWSIVQKSKRGYPIKSKEPPRNIYFFKLSNPF